MISFLLIFLTKKRTYPLWEEKNIGKRLYGHFRHNVEHTKNYEAYKETGKCDPYQEEEQSIEVDPLVIQMLDTLIHATAWLYLKTLCSVKEA